jgi:uncharacterized protein (TIGR00251 family)
MLRIEENTATGSAVFCVRVQPRASKDEVAGELDGALKVRLRAPALEDRANESLVEFIAGVLNTHKVAVRILSGQRSRNKRIEVRGVTAEQVQQLLIHQA